MKRWGVQVATAFLLLLLWCSPSFGSSLREESKSLCMQDPVCSYRFGLHSATVGNEETDEYDNELFAQLFEKTLKDQGLQEEDMPDLDLKNENVRLAWTLFLRTQKFCDDENQQYELDHGCRCKEGKHCDTKCLHTMTFDTLSVTVAIVVIGAMLLWLLHWQGYRTEKLYEYVKRVEEKTQKVLDAQQVIVHIMDSPSGQGGTSYISRAGLRPRTNRDLRV